MVGNTPIMNFDLTPIIKILTGYAGDTLKNFKIEQQKVKIAKNHQT